MKTNTDNDMSEKLQKVLARAGFGSRRQMEAWIESGRVKINNRVAELGNRVTPEDVIQVDDKTITFPHQITDPIVIMYHKPVGEVCTRSDPEGRRTVFEGLPKIASGRWVGVGRLDINTSGLMLFTNDGELANSLMHPSAQIQREYAVRVLGEVDAQMIYNLTHGVELDDGPARFEDLVESGGKGSNQWYHVVVAEGRNRLVRRLWESQGLQVSRLMRVRFGPVFLDKKLRPGETQELDAKTIKELVAKKHPA